MKISFSKEIPNANLRVISLGAGVQSSVMALMAAKGEITPMPDCAIFADTMDEPDEVYTHLEWLTKQLPFPVYVTHNDISLSEALIDTNTPNLEKEDECFVIGLPSQTKSHVFAPLYTKEGMAPRRFCTKKFKIDPVRNKIRQLLGLKKGQRVGKDVIVEQWIGISTDEIQRAKDSRDKYIVHRFPLIEHRMKRHHCHTWFNKEYKNRKLPRSACVYCPYKRNDEWRYLRDNDPKGWQKAVEIDEKLRFDFNGNEQFVHNSKVPLKVADLETAEDKGQLNFLDECDGMCGV